MPARGSISTYNLNQIIYLLPAYWVIPSFTVVKKEIFGGTSTINNAVETKPGKDLPMTATQNYFRSALASFAVNSVMHVPSQPDDSVGVACV